ncbi:HD domain-containing protein [Cuneatibacter caecimuris]|uniref:HD domain-containing protein n=1 Tax=Cuneatibacter caecimuris TaxID=1796618 RepID=A0A4Q7PKG5_9FIRM|nr:HD domain-containing protein [Cuneatibacter caecimuris]RZT01213.1 HD domain-containing protein [Cuneatibacter caecimuris]
MSQYEIAMQIAKKAYKGLKDKAGAEYLNHPVHVAKQMNTEQEKVVALLHDVIEDAGYTVQMLEEMGIDRRCCHAVDVISRRRGEDYMEYILRVKEDSLAAAVKIEDLKHNSDLSRLPLVREEDLQRYEKYQRALEILMEC